MPAYYTTPCDICEHPMKRGEVSAAHWHHEDVSICRENIRAEVRTTDLGDRDALRDTLLEARRDHSRVLLEARRDHSRVLADLRAKVKVLDSPRRLDVENSGAVVSVPVERLVWRSDVLALIDEAQPLETPSAEGEVSNG